MAMTKTTIRKTSRRCRATSQAASLLLKTASSLTHICDIIKKYLSVVFAFAAAAAGAADYPYRAADITNVVVTGGFWLSRVETNRLVTVTTDFQRCEESGRIANFANASAGKWGVHKGMRFDDSDVFKVIEGASYTLATHPDAKLDRYLDDLIAKFFVDQRGAPDCTKRNAVGFVLPQDCAAKSDATLPGAYGQYHKLVVDQKEAVGHAVRAGSLTLIPYFAWCHRGAGEMQTWFRE